MIFWTKKDSNNLESIARSLEKLAEREQERSLINEKPDFFFFKGKKIFHKDAIEKIKVSESPSIEDEAIEEAIQRGQKMQAKVVEAERTKNIPFVIEDLFDEEELETL